jgi:hypothetical protein
MSNTEPKHNLKELGIKYTKTNKSKVKFKEYFIESVNITCKWYILLHFL